MDEKKTAVVKPHKIKIDDRAGGSLTGVKNLVSATPTALTLETYGGALTVSGSGLKLEKYDETLGELSFSGTVDSLKYAGAKVPLMKRIFR